MSSSDSDSGTESPPAELELDRKPSFLRQLTDSRLHEVVKNHSGKILAGSCIAGAAFVFLGVGQNIVATMVGAVYPAFMSYKAVKTQEKDDDTQWLIYWIVFAFFMIIDQWTSFVLDLIPFYHLAKLAFLLYLMFPPDVRGATWIYHTFIESALDRHEDAIDRTLYHVKDVAGDAFELGYEKLSSSLSNEIKKRTGVALDPVELRQMLEETVDPETLTPKASLMTRLKPMSHLRSARKRAAALRQYRTQPTEAFSAASPASPQMDHRDRATSDAPSYDKDE